MHSVTKAVVEKIIVSCSSAVDTIEIVPKSSNEKRIKIYGVSGGDLCKIDTHATIIDVRYNGVRYTLDVTRDLDKLNQLFATFQATTNELTLITKELIKLTAHNDYKSILKYTKDTDEGSYIVTLRQYRGNKSVLETNVKLEYDILLGGYKCIYTVSKGKLADYYSVINIQNGNIDKFIIDLRNAVHGASKHYKAGD